MQESRVKTTDRKQKRADKLSASWDRQAYGQQMGVTSCST